MTKLIDNVYSTSFETSEKDPSRIFTSTKGYFTNEGYTFVEGDMPHRLKFKYKLSRWQRLGSPSTIIPLTKADMFLNVFISVSTIKIDYMYPDRMVMDKALTDKMDQEVNRLKLLLDSSQGHTPPPPPPEDQESDRCGGCGKEVNPDFKVCPYCEQPLKQQPSTCPNCDKDLKPEFKICPYCEHRLNP